MRPPFEMTGDCTAITIDIDTSGFIPDEFPFCSIPSFTDPTLVPREPEVVIPDIMLPDICRCWTYTLTKDIIIGEVGLEPYANWSIHRATDDCCELVYSYYFTLHVPCMPFDFESTGNIEIVDTTAAIDVDLGLRSGTCALDLDVDVDIPCLPFTVSADATINTGKITVDFDRNAGSGICELDLNINISLPWPSFPEPFSCGDLGTVNITVNRGTDETFDVSGAFDQSCNLNLEFDIGFPSFSCGDIAPQLGVSRLIKVGGDGKFEVDAGWSECELQLDFDISFPPAFSCSLLETPSVLVNIGGDGKFEVDAGWSECELQLDFDISFPPAFSCGLLTGDKWIDIASLSGGTCEIMHLCPDPSGIAEAGSIRFVNTLQPGFFQNSGGTWWFRIVGERGHLAWGLDCGHITYWDAEDNYTIQRVYAPVPCMVEATGLDSTYNWLRGPGPGHETRPLELHMGDQCTVYGEFMASIPCPTIAISGNRLKGPGGLDTAPLDAWVDEDCTIKIGFDASLPCPLDLTVRGPYDGACGFTFDAYLQTWDCMLNISWGFNSFDFWECVDERNWCSFLQDTCDWFSCGDLQGAGELITVYDGEGNCVVEHICTGLFEGESPSPFKFIDTFYLELYDHTAATAPLLFLGWEYHQVQPYFTCGHLETFVYDSPTTVYLTGVTLFKCAWLDECIVGGDGITVFYTGEELVVDHTWLGASGVGTINSLDGVTPFTGGLIFNYTPWVLEVDGMGHLRLRDLTAVDLTVTFVT